MIAGIIIAVLTIRIVNLGNLTRCALLPNDTSLAAWALISRLFLRLFCLMMAHFRHHFIDFVIINSIAEIVLTFDFFFFCLLK